MSAPYSARPVTLSVPSCRMGRVPMTLYFFLVVLTTNISWKRPLFSPGIYRENAWVDKGKRIVFLAHQQRYTVGTRNDHFVDRSKNRGGRQWMSHSVVIISCRCRCRLHNCIAGRSTPSIRAAGMTTP